MKCWECKQKISSAKVVHYYSPTEEKSMPRDVCQECYGKLKFDACRHVRVEKITQTSLKIKRLKPTVSYQGDTYKLKSSNIIVPEGR